MSKNNPYSKEIVNKWMRKGVVCPKINHIFFWQTDTKFCWGNEKMVGEMQQFVGEMQHFVGETKQFVGEMKQICWGNEANGWGSEAKCVGEMPRR